MAAASSDAQRKLVEAVIKGQDGRARDALRQGADVNAAADWPAGWPPLLLAAQHLVQPDASRHMFDTLVQLLKADLGATGPGGETLAHVAAATGCAYLVQQVAERAPELAATLDAAGRTPAAVAEEARHWRVALALRQLNPEPAAPPALPAAGAGGLETHIALGNAADAGDMAALQAALAAGGDPSAVVPAPGFNEGGDFTPFEWAIGCLVSAGSEEHAAKVLACVKALRAAAPSARLQEATRGLLLGWIEAESPAEGPKAELVAWTKDEGLLEPAA